MIRQHRRRRSATHFDLILVQLGALRNALLQLGNLPQLLLYGLRCSRDACGFASRHFDRRAVLWRVCEIGQSKL